MILMPVRVDVIIDMTTSGSDVADLLLYHLESVRGSVLTHSKIFTHLI